MNFAVSRNWSPQSHLRLPKRSPVRQAECSRTETGLRQVGLADEDRHLVAQALAAAEHDELGFGRAFQRHGRAADDLQVHDLAPAIFEDARGVRAQEAAVGGRARRHRHDDRRGEDEREPNELQRRLVDGGERGHGRVEARADFQRKRRDTGKVDLGQREMAGLCPLQPQPAQARRREHEPGATPPQNVKLRRHARIERLDDRHDHVISCRTDHDRAAGPEFGDHAVHGDLVGAPVGL